MFVKSHALGAWLFYYAPKGKRPRHVFGTIMVDSSLIF